MPKRKRPPHPPAPTPLDTIYASRQGRRPHYIAQWMEHRGIASQAEVADAVRADKSMVSRWLDDEKPTTPSFEYVQRLNAFFGGDGDPVDIFRDPMDDWMSKFLRGRTEEERRRIQQTLEAAFPKRANS